MQTEIWRDPIKSHQPFKLLKVSIVSCDYVQILLNVYFLSLYFSNAIMTEHLSHITEFILTKLL